MKKRKRNVANSAKDLSTRPKRPWAIVVVVVLVDQLTKLAAPLFVPVVQNTGTVFGVFGRNNTLFTLVSLVIVVGLVFVVFRMKPPTTRRGSIIQAATMLIIGGGIANILDRLVHGYVVDFITLPLWPTFNVADMCVTAGVTIIIWQLFFTKDTEEVSVVVENEKQG